MLIIVKQLNVPTARSDLLQNAEDGQQQIATAWTSSKYRISLDLEPFCQVQLTLGSKKLNSDT